MGSTAKRLKKKYTWEDYKAWPDEERWEIIDGEAYNMTPAPSITHQRISRNLITVFSAHLKGNVCEPFDAPTDVVLDDHNIVQPDILVVCKPQKITPANIQGAPDLIVEILSPATALRDIREKKSLYERFGVREYLVVHPIEEVVERFTLGENGYGVPDAFGWDEILPVKIFPDLELRLWEVFGKELPRKKVLPPAGA